MSGIRRIVVFDLDGVIGKSEHFRIINTKDLAFGLRNRDIFRALSTGINHAQVLAPKGAAQNGAMTLAERRLVNIKFVGIHGPLHDVFAKTVDAGDEYDVAKA